MYDTGCNRNNFERQTTRLGGKDINETQKRRLVQNTQANEVLHIVQKGYKQAIGTSNNEDIIKETSQLDSSSDSSIKVKVEVDK